MYSDSDEDDEQPEYVPTLPRQIAGGGYIDPCANGRWQTEDGVFRVTVDTPSSTKKGRNEMMKKAAAKGYMTALRVGETLLRENCPNLVAGEAVGVCAVRTSDKAHATDLFGLKIAGVNADAACGEANAEASASPLGASASAMASGAQASAKAMLLEDVIEATASAVAAEAKASAGVGMAQLGAHAGASATLGRVEAEILHTPLKVSAEGPGANAETGISWGYTGASAGAHVGEARAGPFGVRAGVKFGGGIRNGVPELDLGPITVPCVVM